MQFLRKAILLCLALPCLFPAGALLYWLVQSILRVGQQSLTNKLIGPPNVRAVRPAAERRVKRVGAGKTEGATRES